MSKLHDFFYMKKKIYLVIQNTVNFLFKMNLDIVDGH